MVFLSVTHGKTQLYKKGRSNVTFSTRSSNCAAEQISNASSEWIKQMINDALVEVSAFVKDQTTMVGTYVGSN
jgi:hypothetical protein